VVRLKNSEEELLHNNFVERLIGLAQRLVPMPHALGRYLELSEEGESCLCPLLQRPHSSSFLFQQPASPKEPDSIDRRERGESATLLSDGRLHFI
jgi:hypothetical protein